MRSAWQQAIGAGPQRSRLQLHAESRECDVSVAPSSQIQLPVIDFLQQGLISRFLTLSTKMARHSSPPAQLSEPMRGVSHSNQ